MNIVFFVGFQILIATWPLLCCTRSSKPCAVKKSVPLPLTPLEKHKNEYRESLQKWGQPTPSLTYRVPSLDCTLCGSRDLDENSDTIIHGHKAPEKLYPWQVYVRGAKKLCGGVLIAPQWVLTAAHCINGTMYTLMGTSNVENYSSNAVFRKVDKEIIHEKYHTSKSNDIALIKLSQSVVYNSYIRPICLPRNIIDFSQSHECYVTGWGLMAPGEKKTAKQLQEIKVQIMSHSHCSTQWRLAEIAITPGQLCTELDRAHPNSGACSGDSGGPLSCRVGNSFYVVGIASMAQSGCLKTALPDLFVKVSYQRQWIIRNIVANGGK